MTLLTLALLLALPAPGAHWAGHEAVTFYLDFDETPAPPGGPYAWKAAGNPYPVGTDFELVPGREGSGWRNTSKAGYLGFAGPGNLPPDAGTVSLWVRAGEDNLFADGRRHALVALPRTIEGMEAAPERWASTGLALSVRKTADNTLDLIAHVGGDSWMRSSEPVTLASLDVSALDPAVWHHVAFGWSFAARKVWLAIDDRVVEGSIPDAITAPHPYLAMVLGNTEDYLLPNQEPWGGALDDVAVLALPYPDAAAVMAADAPLAAARPPVPTHVSEATLFPDDANLARMERVARHHLDTLIETQRGGGWCLAIKWPSHLQYTAKFRLPEPGSTIWLSKDGHTAFGAAQLLWAYEALGDERYLEAARRTGEMYLATQHPELGGWVPGYFVQPDGSYVPGYEKLLIQDHCQTGPLMLLAYLHRVTGEERWLDGAKRAADFLLTAQNPNGSWPHSYDPGKGQRLSALGDVDGAEVNDYGTAAPIANLLAMHRLTGEERYKAAALRGADWLVDAFIDTGKVAGWAAQYDAAGQPIPARHFEPVSVTQYAPRWTAMGLTAAYEATGDDRYLAPLRRALEWFDANKGDGGWWWDYDIETGRPIAMYQRTIYFLDDPAQVQAYMAATGRTAPPQRTDAVNVEQLRNELKRAEQPPAEAGQPDAAALARQLESIVPHYAKTYLDSESQPFNEAAGLYTWPTDSGASTSLVRHQVVRFLDLLMRARAARGDIPANDPVFRQMDAFVGWNKVLRE